jgi:lipopolysaccharide heptosyltransferase I
MQAFGKMRQTRINITPEPEKILIIKPSSLGDIIHSLPFLHTIKKCFPKAEIHWVVARGLHVVLENHPLIDRLWVINKDKWKSLAYFAKTLGEISELFKGLRREKFDLCLDLSGLFRSGLITWASGAKYKLGFQESDEGSPFFYTHKIAGGMEDHAVDRYLKIAVAIGCAADEIAYPMVPFEESPPLLKELPGEYLLMAPSAGKEANRWPAARFGELAARLPLPTLVISAPVDQEVVAEVLKHSHGKAISLAGKTNLLELLALIKKARFLVANDTGPIHIAAAFGVPVFAIFGPANPRRTGPYGKIHTIIQEELPCSPCYAWKPCAHWRCMEDLQVEKVYRIIEGKLGEMGLTGAG